MDFHLHFFSAGAAVLCNKAEPISSTHLTSLYAAFSTDLIGANWTYLSYRPYANTEEFHHWAMTTSFGEDPKFYTITNESGPAGIASYLT